MSAYNVGRHFCGVRLCWLVCRGTDNAGRQTGLCQRCDRTQKFLNATTSILNTARNSVLSSFLSSRMKVAENPIVRRRAIQSWVRHNRFLLRRFFSASKKHVNDTSKSRFFAKILRCFLHFCTQQNNILFLFKIL